MSNELIKTTDIKPAEVFIPQGLDPILKEIEQATSSLVPDISTDKGRKEIASICYKIKRSKTYLDNMGKEYVTELKKKPKIVDAERKRMRDYLEKLESSIRQPLTEWEQEEQKRIDEIKARIASIDPFDSGINQIGIDDYSIDEFQAMLKKAVDFEIDGTLGELAPDAIKTKEWVIPKLEKLIEQKQKHIEEQAELERLRKEAEERERKEREERIAREAREAAQREAEEKAKAEAEKAERERQAAKEAQEAAERRAKEAEERSKREAEEAAQRERERYEREKQQAEEEARKREADKKHFATINNEVVKALLGVTLNGEESGEVFLSSEQAKVIVTAIAKKQIPHTSITY